MSEPYNYSTFVMAKEQGPFREFPKLCKAGTIAPGKLSLESLDGSESIGLKSLWSGGPAIFEFGSFT